VAKVVGFLALTAGGVNREFLSCHPRNLEPTNGHCEFKCESEFDAQIGDFSLERIRMGTLSARCGPIIKCPEWVQINTTHIQLSLGIGVDLGGSVTKCIP
jgi:hypothetical protein